MGSRPPKGNAAEHFRIGKRRMDWPIRIGLGLAIHRSTGWIIRPGGEDGLPGRWKIIANGSLNRDLANPSYGAIRRFDKIQNASQRCPKGEQRRAHGFGTKSHT